MFGTGPDDRINQPSVCPKRIGRIAPWMLYFDPPACVSLVPHTFSVGCCEPRFSSLNPVTIESTCFFLNPNRSPLRFFSKQLECLTEVFVKINLGPVGWKIQSHARLLSALRRTMTSSGVSKALPNNVREDSSCLTSNKRRDHLVWLEVVGV